jgi:hypothetical protein
MDPETVKIVVVGVVILLLGALAIAVFRVSFGKLIERIEAISAAVHGVASAKVVFAPQADQRAIASKDAGVSSEGLKGYAPTVVVEPVTAATSAELEPAAASAAGASTAVAAATDATRLQAMRDFGLSPLITQAEAAIHSDLQMVPEGERVDLLVRHLAVIQLHVRAERIYRTIYGSQIHLLQHLNNFGPKPIAQLENDFYKAAVARFPDYYAQYSKDAATYFAYLENVQVIAKTGPDGANYEITLTGKAFLQWLIAESILPDKAL